MIDFVTCRRGWKAQRALCCAMCWTSTRRAEAAPASLSAGGYWQLVLLAAVIGRGPQVIAAADRVRGNRETQRNQACMNPCDVAINCERDVEEHARYHAW